MRTGYGYMAQASSPYAVFRASDWNSVLTAPAGLRNCLRIELKVIPQKRYNSAKEWNYPEEATLKHVRSASFCMTSQHFSYCSERHCSEILTCHINQSLIPQADQLTSTCQCMMQQQERKIGLCPDAA